jgi:hypothetical protein
MTTPEIVLTGSLALTGINGTAPVIPRSIVTGAIATETYFFGTQIPANAQIERQTFRILLWGQASTTGTLTLRIRAGAATASAANDPNVVHTLTTGSMAANMWARYEALVTVTSLNPPNFTVTGVGECRTGPSVVVGPQNAVEKMVSIPQANPWYLSMSGQITGGTFQVRHAAITAL